MSKHDFSNEEFADRLRRVRAAMGLAGLDWIVAIHPVSIHWLTGSDAKSYQEFQCLLIGARDQPLVALVRAGEVNELVADSLANEVVGWGGGIAEDPIAAFAALAHRHGVIGTRVGLEVPAYYLHPLHYVRLIDVLGDGTTNSTGLIDELKLVKSPAELGYIRRAAALADVALDAFVAELAPGKTELALAGTVQAALLGAGSGIAASPINLVSGPRSAFSHGAPTGRVLQLGDFGNVEFGATVARYTATIGRQFAVGAATARMRELHALVRRASDAMIAQIRDGVTTAIVHESARTIIADAGLDRCRVHLSGYGLAPGFPPSWAEPIQMLDGDLHTLRAGMVVTIEPPVFIGPEALGARLIDNVLVTDNGAERLSAHCRDLIVA